MVWSPSPSLLMIDTLVVDCEYACEVTIWVESDAGWLSFSGPDGARIEIQTESHDGGHLVKILPATSQIIIS